MNYKKIVENVYYGGVSKEATRIDSDGNIIPVENGTIGTFAEIFRHDMSEGFPLSTLRKLPWKSIRVELEGFIKGISDKSWYQERGCGFWNEWANPQIVEEMFNSQNNVNPVDGKKIKSKKEIQKECNDLGSCIYGASWRNFHDPEATDGQSVDQLGNLVKTLKESPYDRRMVVSAWNPLGVNHTALHWCHFAFNIVVYGDQLNLIWHQRSCDLILGVPANIASYALLLLLLCEESGLQPGELVGTLADCHIYNNLLSATNELLKRDERSLPQVRIKRKEDGSFSIFDWTWDDVELIDYDPHPPINMGAVTV